MDDHEFDWEVLEILNEDASRRGAMVRYTPCDERCEPIVKFVPIPWHKCTDADHAREVCGKKIAARAPRREWDREINPPPEDKSDEITKELSSGDTAKGEFRRK